LLIPALVIGALICFYLLRRDPTFDRRRLWKAAALPTVVLPVLFRFLATALLMGLAVAFFKPDLLFALPRTRSGLWAAIMVLYPVLSVYPQELIYRAFLSHRYRVLFPGRWWTIAASGASFGYAHIIFKNGLAVALTLAGGILFAWTYERSKSLAAAALEHSLYGGFIFTIGLGAYFYAGHIQ
jgi:membrane protease YdiL (CAAX protease family)